MKKIILLSIICLIAVLAVTHNGQSKIKSYYSGDAINFNDQLYVGSTNTDSLEVFKLQNKELIQLAQVRPYNDKTAAYGRFYDLKFASENGRLFVYAVTDFSLYKYELVGDNQLVLISKERNTYWEWYNRIDKFGDNIVTISDKGVKIWNADLQVIDGYNLTSLENGPSTEAYSSHYNIRSYNNRYVLNVQNNNLIVFNQDARVQAANIPLNYKQTVGNRQAFQDENNDLFVVDDYYAKKFDLTGRLLGSFRHLDYEGFDMAASGYSNYIYFSNGVGVVKLRKDTMALTTYRYTTGLGGAQGWAMGLKAVDVNGSDRVVLFNNSNILILDQNLNKLAVWRSTEEEDPVPTENLYLALDHTTGSPNANITVIGGGYLANEKLTFDFGGVKTSGFADFRGRLEQKLVVPNVAPKAVDIKVVGETSRLSYSISFKIQ